MGDYVWVYVYNTNFNMYNFASKVEDSFWLMVLYVYSDKGSVFNSLGSDTKRKANKKKIKECTRKIHQRHTAKIYTDDCIIVPALRWFGNGE